MYVKRVAAVISIVVCCAGMAAGQTAWVGYPGNPIIGPGDPGSWDAGGHWVHSVVFDGSTFHMWFTGVDQSGYLSDVGHATSSDGVDWIMDPANPVLTRGPDGEWDDGNLSSTAVIHDGTEFRMWYGASDGVLVRTGYATSPDGSVWTKFSGNPVLSNGDSGSWDENQAQVWEVILVGDTYRLWYSAADSTPVYRIGHAESTDGIHWTKSGEPVLDPGVYPGAWDPALGNCSVVSDGTTYHMWYTGGRNASNSSGFGYAFSSDGIDWKKHRGNPVVIPDDENFWNPIVLLDDSTWRMWYSHWDGSVEWISYATSDRGPGVDGLTHAQYIPAAALASGAEGSFYQTDLDLNNAGGQPVEYQFLWLPRGEDCSDPTASEVFSLGAGMSVRYANVLSEVFGLEPNSLGALSLLSSSSDLLAVSRTYNTPSAKTAGTFGQSVPAVSASDFIQSGERQRILFASENADLRTNVGCQNGGPTVTPVNVDLFNSDGTSLETARIVLYPWSNDQLNRVFQDYQPVDGYVDVWATAGERSFYCYGSVLDNVTSDPTTILPQ